MLPHPIDPATAVLATSKLQQRERFAEAGVPHPRHVVCATVEEAAAAGGRLRLPVRGQGARPPGAEGPRARAGTSPCSRPRSSSRSASRGASVVLVEELVPGREVTVNAFSVDGRFTPLTVTDRVVAEPPAFGVALAHVWPSSLAPEEVGAAVEAARAAAEALGVREGPTYTQVVVGERGAHVVELAARLGGGHDAELCHAALDVDLNALALSAALGEPVADERLRPRTAAGGAVVRFLVPEPGELQEVAGVEEAEAMPGIGWVRIYREPGRRARPAAARLRPRRRGARRRRDPRGGAGAR